MFPYKNFANGKNNLSCLLWLYSNSIWFIDTVLFYATDFSIATYLCKEGHDYFNRLKNNDLKKVEGHVNSIMVLNYCSTYWLVNLYFMCAIWSLFPFLSFTIV